MHYKVWIAPAVLTPKKTKWIGIDSTLGNPLYVGQQALVHHQFFDFSIVSWIEIFLRKCVVCPANIHMFVASTLLLWTVFWLASSEDCIKGPRLEQRSKTAHVPWIFQNLVRESAELPKTLSQIRGQRIGRQHNVSVFHSVPMDEIFQRKGHVHDNGIWIHPKNVVAPSRATLYQVLCWSKFPKMNFMWFIRFRLISIGVEIVAVASGVLHLQFQDWHGEASNNHKALEAHMGRNSGCCKSMDHPGRSVQSRIGNAGWIPPSHGHVSARRGGWVRYGRPRRG